MREPYVYDKAKYHTGGNWPKRLPMYQSFVHTGLFLGWLIDCDLLSHEFRKNSEKTVTAFQQRKMTGPQVYEYSDGVLIDDMLNEEGNAFARVYFDFEEGQFLQDYEELLAFDLPTIFHVQDTWENYQTLKDRINARYESWKQNAQ